MPSITFKKFWNSNKWVIAVSFSIVVLFFCWLLKPSSKNVVPEYTGLGEDHEKLLKPKRKICKKKNELECKRILEKIFKKPFTSIRPDWLKYPKTKRNLEIDGFNDTIGKGLGFEYNGSQHYKYSSYFHKEYEDFVSQVERDKFKLNKCKELGIEIISIPYTVKFEKLEHYITEELKKLNLYPNEENS